MSNSVFDAHHRNRNWDRTQRHWSRFRIACMCSAEQQLTANNCVCPAQGATVRICHSSTLWREYL